MKVRGISIGVGTLVLMAALAGLALASHGGFVKGPPVADGESPYGVPWSIYAGKMDGAYLFEFDIEPPGYDGVGWSAAMPRRAIRKVGFVATSGSDLSEFPEGDVSGVTARRVRNVRLLMSDGSEISFSPTKAPARVIERKPWLKRFRVFDVFFSDDIHAVAMETFDRMGDLIERREADRGSFFPRAFSVHATRPALATGASSLSNRAPRDARIDPSCRVRLSAGAESHAIEFTTRCNFSQRRVVIRPDNDVLGIDHSPAISQGDQNDELRCERRSESARMVCRGKVDKGARVKGSFETAAFSCDVASRIKILGPATRLKVRRVVAEPRGCR
jgi:hypothetical protein